MRYEIVLSLEGREQILQVISETLKKWPVWKVQFMDGKEAVLFKCGNVWMQRYEDSLDYQTITAIGKKIDNITLSAKVA